MDIQTTKLELIQFILNSDKEDVINEFQSIVDKANQEEIAGYTPDGRPITMAELNKRLAQSEEDIKKGRLTSDEDLKKEIESW